MSDGEKDKINWGVVLGICSLLVALSSFAFDVIDPIETEKRLSTLECVTGVTTGCRPAK